MRVCSYSLKLIRADLEYIRKNRVARDMVLTEDEEQSLEDARDSLRKGQAKTLDEVMRARRSA